jgi:hypothetical protein
MVMDPNSSWFRWKLRISAVVWFVLLVGFLLALPITLDIGWPVPVGLVVLALALALPIAALTRLLFAGQRRQRWSSSVAKAFIGCAFSLNIIAALPLYVATIVTSASPLVVPQATLSNGRKTVVFQGMVHVGAEPFYKSVVYDIEQALSDGFVIYYEGVQPSEGGDMWFAGRMAGGGDLSDNYKKLAGICGLQFQLDYFQVLAADMQARPDRHVQADVSTADLKQEFERLQSEDPSFRAQVQAADDLAQNVDTAADSLSTFVDLVGSGTSEQRRLAGYACRGILTWLLSDTTAESGPLGPVILDCRNSALAERIVEDAHQKIYITYGAAHLPGLIADLQAVDPAWRVESVKWLRVIAGPDVLRGRLEITPRE